MAEGDAELIAEQELASLGIADAEEVPTDLKEATGSISALLSLKMSAGDSIVSSSGDENGNRSSSIVEHRKENVRRARVAESVAVTAAVAAH